MLYTLFDQILLIVLISVMTIVLALPKPKKEEDPFQPLKNID